MNHIQYYLEIKYNLTTSTDKHPENTALSAKLNTCFKHRRKTLKNFLLLNKPASIATISSSILLLLSRIHMSFLHIATFWRQQYLTKEWNCLHFRNESRFEDFVGIVFLLERQLNQSIFSYTVIMIFTWYVNRAELKYIKLVWSVRFLNKS